MPPSLPWPDSFTPPNGVSGVDTATELTPTMPDSIASPIAPIVTFKTFDEVVERANSLPYGLAAYAFTSSNATAAAIGEAIESGMVGVNSVAVSTPETPFGGVKESGHGSEGGIEGLGAYLNTKFISQG